MHAALSARINKTDRNDAMGIAQMMRVGPFKPVHVKTPASQQRRLLLTSRKLLRRKAYDIESDLRGQLRNFGLKVGIVGTARPDRATRLPTARLRTISERPASAPLWADAPRKDGRGAIILDRAPQLTQR